MRRPCGVNFGLARPRRFGKSLMITTLKEIFNGRKDLFEGLAISKTDWEWKKHPVLHFNFGFAAAATSYEQFESMLNDEIERALGEVGCEFDPKRAPGSNLARAIDALAAKAMRGEGELPVILIDEYDDPVAKVLHDIPFAEKVRSLLATFYGQLKDQELLRRPLYAVRPRRRGAPRPLQADGRTHC